MKRKPVSSLLGTGVHTKFLIFSYAISTLFVFSSSIAVWAKAPETEKIVFVSKRDGNAEIYIMNPDGSQQVNLTQHPAEDYNPAWSPNGKQIVFTSDRTDDTFDLYLMNADGKNVQKVFKDDEYRRYSTWSPDGKRIAYAQADKRKAILAWGARFAPIADHTLYIATPNGTSIEKLTKGFRPGWSPDGSQLIFVVAGLKHAPLGLFDLQTRTQKVLRPEKLPWTTSPRWSPQGDKIAFGKLSMARFNERGGITFRGSTLYIANPDGTALQQVADGSALDPTWSPQGNQLIYSDAIGVVYQLYRIDFNGGNPTQLTHEGNNFGADWFDPFYSVSSSGQLLTTMWGKIKAD